MVTHEFVPYAPRSLRCAVCNLSAVAHSAPTVEAAEIRRQPCTWQMDSWDEAELWETDCGQTWQFETGTPTDNKMSYCCYCGKPLKQRINMHFRARDAAPIPSEKDSGVEAT